ELLGVRLGDRGDFFATLAGAVECGAHDALAAAAREDRSLNGDLVRRAGVKPAADGGIFAFGVLTINQHVDGPRRLVAQRRRHAFEKISRPEIKVEVKPAP